MSEAKQIIARALARADRRAQATPKVDYAALNRMVRRQRAALTRAVNSGDPERVIIACRDAVNGVEPARRDVARRMVALAARARRRVAVEPPHRTRRSGLNVAARVAFTQP